MTNIEQQFLDELLFCIKENDLQKSYALLQFIPTISPEIQNRSLFEISNANDQLAYSMFEYLVRVKIEDDSVRNKLYEIILDKGRVNNEFYFIYIRMAEEKRMDEAVPVLLDIITTETNIGILMETIRALAIIGNPSSVMALSEFIYYNDEMLKREAVMALERIGGSAARQSLEFAAKTSKANPMIFSTIDKLRKIENLPPFKPESKPAPAEIGGVKTSEPVKEEKPAKKEMPAEKAPEEIKEEIEIEVPEHVLELIKNFNSGDVELRHKAIDALIETGEDCISAVVHNMDMNDADNLINSLDILGNIGSRGAASPILKVIDSKHKDSNVRFAAFEALERLPKLKSALVLTEGITDPAEQVRIAAASAIDKNLSDVLVAGIRSKIDPGDKISKIVIEGIIDSRAVNTFEKLLESDAFTFGFSNYLTHDAAPEVREFFIELLRKRGNRALAGRIDFDTQKDKVLNRKLIFAVDDSRIMLNYYIKKIHKMGHSAQVFTDPNKAVEMTLKSKPALVITDLNMLEITGLQFAKSIREIYPTNLLPVVIVTTQGDFVEQANMDKKSTTKEQIENAGITAVLKKPLNTNDLVPLIDEDEKESGFTDLLYTLSSEFPDVRYKSYLKILKDAPAHINKIAGGLEKNENDLALNKLNIIAKTRDPKGFETAVKFLNGKPKNPNLRFAVLRAYLSTMPDDHKINESFVKYIEDPSEHVRIAVTKILNKANSDAVNLKLKEMIETGSRIARIIVAAIIDSKADSLFKSLLNSDAFTFVASDHLARSAHPVHREFFLEILKSRGSNSLVRSIERETEELPITSKSILVVEDSNIMQDYYMSKLHSAGFITNVLDNPLDVMTKILQLKPNLIITSFVLPDISGVQMAENIRKDLPPEDLPVVMVTSQSDFVQNQISPTSVYKQHIGAKGVDRIFTKPLKTKDIEVIRSLMD